jgi:hypothetical protein
MPLRGPSAPQLAGLAVFRSRHVEDGRERFRLHLGFFASEADAECLLPVVREDYPGAIAAVAPEGSMGSLDDTAAARFSILRPVARSAAPMAGTLSRPLTAPAALRAAPHPPLRVVTSPPTATRSAPPARPTVAATAPPRQPAARANPAIARMSSAAANAPMRSLFEAPRTPTFTGNTAAPATVPPKTAQAVAADAEASEGQHYAVQLIWNQGPVDLDSIPLLAIFTGYLLYAVESEPGPRRCYGVRLGFYADAMSARLVAQYVRSEFKGVAVVPVSPREMSRASSAAIRLGASRRNQSLSGGRTRWPASALAVDPKNLRRAITPGAG